MNCAVMKDGELLESTLSAVHDERVATVNVLTHLMEVDRRRLFSAQGFPSLHKYATQELGYSDDEAQRRISAMRLMRELPQIREKIEAGALSLTNLSLAQSLFRHSDCSTEKKIEILGKIENKSTREAQKYIFSIAPPEFQDYERITQVTEDKVSFQFSGDEALAEKLQRLKSMLAHSDPDISMNNLLHKLCDLAFEQWNPLWAPKKRSNIEREVWRRDRGCCVQCESTHALQVDHIVPKAHGGGDEIENLRLLCRNCNQRAAVEKLGLEKMERHLNQRAI